MEESRKIVFGIDCDEVLRSLLQNMVDLYNYHFKQNLSKDDVKDFKVEVSFPRITEKTGCTASHWFFQKHGHELFYKSGAFPKIRENIETLQKYGEVVIITYQKSYNNKIDTLRWLDKNGIRPDGICFLKDKTVVHCDWFIDDNTWNFIGCNAEHGVIIDAPYNRDIPVQDVMYQSNCRYMHKFNSLDEFVEWFVKNNKNM